MQKRRSALFILVLALASCGNGLSSSSSNGETVNVIIMSGQSNMEGWTRSKYLSTNYGEADLATFSSGYENVGISYKGAYTNYSSDADFVNVKLGQGLGEDFFGPEIGIAKKYSSLKKNKKLYLIKYAAGGTSLSSDWKLDGSLYSQGIDYILKSLSSLILTGLTPRIISFLWAQGEADALNESDSKAYKANEKSFIESVRNSLKDYYVSSLPFIDAGVSSSPVWTYSEAVNKAKEENAKEMDVIFFSTIEAGLHYDEEPPDSPDKSHFDSDSMVKLGEIFMSKCEGYLL